MIYVLPILIWLFCLAAAGAALYQAWRFYQEMMTAEEGTEEMKSIAESVRQGAAAYLTQQFKVVGIVFAVVFVLLCIAAYVLQVLSGFVPFAFLLSGFLSGLAGWLGMKTATQASSRTAAAAERSLNAGLKVAFRSGAVMGLIVVGLGLLDLCMWYFLLGGLLGFDPRILTVIMLGFGMGASGQALFARVGGGIFTKAADVGADLVGKVEEDFAEDSPRNPATIADNVGDNVGDVAGMGADLYESFYGSMLASAALGVAAMSSEPLLTAAGVTIGENTIWSYQISAMLLPIAIGAAGVLLAIAGMYLVRTEEDATQKNLLKAIGRGINAASGLVALAAIALVFLLLPAFFGLAFSIITGLVAGWIIGKWTEYSTSDEFGPTQRLAERATSGVGPLVISGIAEGMYSVWVPVLVVGLGTLAAFGFATGGHISDPVYFPLGLFGVGLAAVGMLSTLGITLATDAYGPIADNAGGNAEMAELEPHVRQRTDALDSLGNTTAATGKGFAIGSAALTVLALLAAYVEAIRAGFEQWGASVVPATATVGIYKAAPSLAVQVVQQGTETQRYYWLLFTDDGSEVDPWLELPPTPIEAPLPGTQWEIQLGDPSDPRLHNHALLTRPGQATKIEAVALRNAQLSDFMDYYDANVMNPKVLVGLLLGAMTTFVFCALTMKAVGKAADEMVQEVRRQLRERPGIKDGSQKPDYESPVRISTLAAQREMILPTLLGLLIPVAVGIILGVGGSLGLLVGALTSGFCVAIFMANSGGAWDNAKKYIEGGKLGGKGTEAHKAAVVGDTVGDPFKDTSGPSLNILIKLMSMVSVVVAGLVVRYSFQALGWF